MMSTEGKEVSECCVPQKPQFNLRQKDRVEGRHQKAESVASVQCVPGQCEQIRWKLAGNVKPGPHPRLLRSPGHSHSQD
jgi:hypothetical protein